MWDVVHIWFSIVKTEREEKNLSFLFMHILNSIKNACLKQIKPILLATLSKRFSPNFFTVFFCLPEGVCKERRDDSTQQMASKDGWSIQVRVPQGDPNGWLFRTVSWLSTQQKTNALSLYSYGYVWQGLHFHKRCTNAF